MPVGIPQAQLAKLQKHRIDLITNIVVNDIFLSYFEKIGLKGEEIAILTSDNAKSSEVVKSVESSSNFKAFEILIEALVETKQCPLALRVDKKLATRYITEHDKRDKREEPFEDNVDAIDSKRKLAASEEDKKILQEIEKLNAANISLVRPTKLDPRHEQGAYMVRAVQSKRHAIIINNMFFTKGNLKTRNGTECDKANLLKLLDELVFKVTMHEDLNVENIEKALAEDCRIANEESVDIIMVFILSHGCLGAFYDQDSKPIYFNPMILDIFHSEQYPKLCGKPKLFFIQACQTVPTAGDKQLPVADVEKPMNFFPDTLLAFSTCANYKSWRSPAHGSWFIRALICILARDAYKATVQEIMTVVCRIVSQMKEDVTDRTQLPQNTHTLGKPCFLFPDF